MLSDKELSHSSVCFVLLFIDIICEACSSANTIVNSTLTENLPVSLKRTKSSKFNNKSILASDLSNSLL